MKSLFFLFIFLIGVNLSQAQSSAEKEVALAVEQLRINLIKPEQKSLEKLVSDNLSYGHSSGLVQDKKGFIESLLTGRFHVESLELSNQTIHVIEKTAIVRHHFFAHAHDEGKPPSIVNLGVLQIWQKREGGWILLARQAFQQLK